MSLRTDLATKCKLGSFEFWATATSGGGARRLARYSAIGVDGAELEDLGEDAKTEELTAYLTETEWTTLENLRREGQEITVVHPLFGVFQGRIEKASYDADAREGVIAKITVVEDGAHVAPLGTAVSSPASAASSAAGAASAFSDGLDDLDDLDGMTDDLSDAADLMGDALDSWDSMLDLVESGAAAWEELGAGFDSLTSAVSGFVDQLDLAVGSVAGLAELALEDLAYSCLAAGREAVDAVGSVISSTTEPFRVLGELSLSAVAREAMPLLDPEEAIAQLLVLNPSIIDVNCVPVGFELVIPVSL